MSMRILLWLVVGALPLPLSALAQGQVGSPPRFAATPPFHDCNGLICIDVSLMAQRLAGYCWIPATFNPS